MCGQEGHHSVREALPFREGGGAGRAAGAAGRRASHLRPGKAFPAAGAGPAQAGAAGPNR